MKREEVTPSLVVYPELSVNSFATDGGRRAFVRALVKDRNAELNSAVFML